MRDNPYTRDPREATTHGTVPASLSSAFVDGLLRRDLGFQGLVVTDAGDMGALADHFTQGEIAVRRRTEQLVHRRLRRA